MEGIRDLKQTRRRQGARQLEVKFPALKLISIIVWSFACVFQQWRRVGLATSRDGHFIFRFVVPKIHGNSSIKSKNVFWTLFFVFYLQTFDISFALQRKSRLTFEV